MKVTLHGVITSICLLGLVGLVKFQGLMVKDQNEFVKEVIAIDEFHDERLLSLENTIQPGVCIRPKTAVLKRGLNNTMVFSVKTCEGKTLTIRKSLDIKA